MFILSNARFNGNIAGRDLVNNQIRVFRLVFGSYLFRTLAGLTRTLTNRCRLFLSFPGEYLNLLKPTGHVMHQKFNIQQLYVLPTLYLSENKQRLVPLIN